MVRGGRPRRGRGRGIGGSDGGSGRFHRSRSPLERNGGGRGSRSRYRGGGIRRRTPSPFVPRELSPHRQRRRIPSPFVPRDTPPRRSHSRRRTPSPFQPRDSIDPLIEAIRRKTEELRRSVERHEQNLISTREDRINYGEDLQSAATEFYLEPNENDLNNIDDEYEYNDADIIFDDNDEDDNIDDFDGDEDDDYQNDVDSDEEAADRFIGQGSDSQKNETNNANFEQPPVRIKDPVMSLDEKKCTAIRKQILSNIDEISISSNEEPQFKMAVYTIDDGVGYYDILCANAESEKWLIKNVISWRNLWEGQTMALQCQEAPTRKSKIQSKSSRYILEFHSGRNKVRDILRKFEKAHRGLSTYDWVVIRSVCVSGDNIIRVSVPAVAYFKLRKTNMIPRGLSASFALKLIGKETV